MLKGGMDAGFVQTGMVDDSTQIMRATLQELQDQGLSAEDAATAMAGDLVALAQAYEATGQELPEDLAAAMADAGIEVQERQIDILADIRDGIGKLSGQTFGAANGFGSSPMPLNGRGPYSPAMAPNMGGGLGPMIQTHAGEGVLIIPKKKFGAAQGLGRDGQDVGGRAGANVSFGQEINVTVEGASPEDIVDEVELAFRQRRGTLIQSVRDALGDR
jgi:hypothetical protein